MSSPTENHHWTMIIDLDRCTGCQACVVACHVENNVTYVGEEEVAMGRFMHWLLIQRYWGGEYPNMQARFSPIPCQQCKEAPCEPVCPVYATYHSEQEMLNIQVYNRCIGVRFCANNCPYKVRVFNWFNPQNPEPLDQMLNPDVTVRSRGVIEKCTFCIHRIRRAEEDARYEGRPVRDGEVQPACVQACPPEAFVFGDRNDPESRVAKMAESRRGFRLLDDVGTVPEVVYLKRGVTDVEGI
ncbi:MAG: 4Fe-4S dicluster domain-containing protein [Chloroflexi bacterium]|nr:4Fe-4S dicluster domain-containing protein [Chloroflexota bacterium]